jgi:hypothetical protein
MDEAVEIAKLRLFLKLVAQVSPDLNKKNMGLEPLPDIDFNIKAGNTLVGFATLEELQNAVQQKLDFGNAVGNIQNEANDIKLLFDTYQQVQMDGDHSVGDYKQAIRTKLAALNEKLNQHLAWTYGINHSNKAKYQAWLQSHQPFHWYVEFYGIMQKGGFDVIIGNPPYVEYSQVKKEYQIKNYQTESCGNLYAHVIERSQIILSISGFNSFIVQLPIVCTDRMIPLQTYLLKNSLNIWYSNYDDRPGKLFDGLQHIRATIFIAKKRSNNEIHKTEIYSSQYNRWYSESRPYLFESIQYSCNQSINILGSIPKFGRFIANSTFLKILKRKILSVQMKSCSDYQVYFHNAPQYWIRAMDFEPYFWNERDGEKRSVQVKTLSFNKGRQKNISVGVINSSLFYWWFILLSDCRHLNLREIENFPVGLDEISDDNYLKLEGLSKELMADYQKNAKRKEAYYKATGKVIYDEFYPKKSKLIIDEIDKVLAEHYGFTEEELDFIINYDIKYRMGKELESGEE